MQEMENIYCDPQMAGGIDVFSIRANDDAVKAAIDVIEAGYPKWVTAPISNTANGVAGTMAYDGSFLYVCTATDTWARVAIGGVWSE